MSAKRKIVKVENIKLEKVEKVENIDLNHEDFCDKLTIRVHEYMNTCVLSDKINKEFHQKDITPGTNLDQTRVRLSDSARF